MFKNIVIVGTGYVGIPVAAMFADKGFNVIGINRTKEKVDLINKGLCPIEGDEPNLPELIEKVVKGKNLIATTDYSACKNADAILICVETPFDSDKWEPRYDSLKSALKSIAENMSKGTLVIVESTIAPTTMDTLVKPLLENISKMKAGEDFLLGNCPERVMPGKLLYNIENLSRVCGGINKATQDKMLELYSHIVKGELYPTDCITAEVVKTAENAYRDVEIAFANEVALICEKLGINAYEVRDLVNKAPYRNMHLPGAGVGGHCLPKDSLLLSYGVKGLLTPELMILARNLNKKMPIHTAGLLIDLFKEKGIQIKGSKITVCGFAYLENSDDTRNTPALEVINTLINKGANVEVHDPFVRVYEGLEIKKDFYNSIKDSEALVFVTAHSEYKKLDLNKIKQLMKTPIIIDGRNIFEKEEILRKGFLYRGVGKG
ncbi:MAG: UDP-N-acetyl-D-mannosamine dehydrogenase [Candidatus Methanofastidiosum methylothiophilum]|uniref:UDP-N-acetyl-D-mannosamine dehydrogenase n=1 Tax=Candidatus Methanofastidiosum methylothiophilum TaxID=1705564 RepID=A0A150IR26_9EURY|nr:MAG: UDP-N-acetyl-D-mannosamine dehydrogenase [Candidatus Methanofastidiosum methylthiophilus]KYC47420.1 MAG: UDP-N-acetyl-D-mannosamine dehydrogenase [Candidatus Methanofastidiosum methylthiophilus]KYC49604.1 MAG: UDP-N-acetyl-D-mannosamine dehydrogenase [Candidatus Methanofastidiosum methylthiophilus]